MATQALTIQIGPFAYEVERVERLYSSDHTPLYGDIDYAALRIRLAAEQHPRVQLATLWHELIHGVLTNAGLTDHDERLVDLIAVGVVDLLRQNPALRALELPWPR